MFSMVYEFMNQFYESINQHSFFLVTGLVCHGGRSGKIATEELDTALSDVPDLVLAESVKVRPEHSVTVIPPCLLGWDSTHVLVCWSSVVPTIEHTSSGHCLVCIGSVGLHRFRVLYTSHACGQR